MGSATYSLSAGKRHADKELGGDLNRRRIEGPAPYKIETFEGLINFIKLGNSLTTFDIDPTIINSKDNNGLTPLHYAAQLNPEAIRVLVDNGAWIPIKDNNGFHTFTLCWTIKSKAIPVLVDNGADPNIKDNNGLTPLHHAVRI